MTSEPRNYSQQVPKPERTTCEAYQEPQIFPRLCDQSTIKAEEVNEETSLFQFIGVQGDGAVSKLCKHCQWMLDNWAKYEEDNDFKFPHYQTPIQLRQSAYGECALCYQFWKSRAFGQAQDNVPCDDTVEGFISASPTSGIALCFLPPVLDCKDKRASASQDELPYKLPDEIWWGRLMAIPSVSLAPISLMKQNALKSTRSALDLAKRWLIICQQSHWKCINSIDVYRPTRLISIDGGIARLKLSENSQEDLPYATLSHCWGTYKCVTLLTKNIVQFQDQVPEQALSQTIKDAIEIAHGLGFFYLWIDTLCIVQDDPADWERESTMMSAVYGGSRLNIAASGATDGTVGCFFERPQHWRCQADLIYQEEKAVRCDFVHNRLYDDTLTSMPLMSRGWALQERLLSARTLHFTTTEVFWECHHETACETFPEGLPTECMYIYHGVLEKQPLNLSLWPWLVERYSQCKVTYPTDKLVAISGLARHVQKQTRDQYVAGMWRTDLEYQLCWTTGVPAPRRDDLPYIAPSWSWASVDTSVSMRSLKAFRRLNQIWITIIGIHLKTSGADPYGALSAATLRLSCDALLPIRAQTCPLGYDDWMILNYRRLKCNVIFDERKPKDVEEGHEAYALPVYEDTSDGFRFRGLLLEAVGGQRGIYQRIGAFSISKGEPSEAFLSAVSLSPCNVNLDLFFEVRLDKFQKPHHIIHLI